MPRCDIEITARKLVADYLNVEEKVIVQGSNFIEDLGADSLDLVEIVMDVEETFGIEIPDSEAEAIQTWGELVDVVEKKLQLKGVEHTAQKEEQPVTLQLVMTVKYLPNGVSEDVLRQMLHDVASGAANRGLLTGDTAAEVESHDWKVQTLNS